eukprot:COSAG05_NODE_3310_length_2158_cov_1.379310_1_plen_182_part_00
MYIHVCGWVAVLGVEVTRGGCFCRLTIKLNGTNTTLYSIIGSEVTKLSIPPAYHTPTFGVNFGGVKPDVIKKVAAAKYDSWLTVGITDGNSDDVLGSAGLKFADWTSNKGIEANNSAVFWMDPTASTAKGSAAVTVAQLTVPKGLKFNCTMGLQGKKPLADAKESGEDNWRAEGVTFPLGQ